MKVSICIPVYNGANYLRECMESVLAQTYTDFEVVVADDCSTDETCEIALGFSDPRVKLHRSDRNRGLAANFNHAVSFASGEYVKVLCHDDSLDKTCLERQVEMLEQSPQAVMATSGFRLVDGSGRTVRTLSYLDSPRLLNYGEVVAGTFVTGNLPGPPAAGLIRRSALQKAGQYCEALPQVLDLDMWLRLATQGLVGYLPEPLCSYRYHPQAGTSQHRRSGIVRSDLLSITRTMLSTVTPSFLTRRIAWGRISGSFLIQAATGVRHGYLRWPLSAVWQAFQIDPCFFGLAMFLTFFNTGILGIACSEDRRLTVRRGRILAN